MLKCVAMLKAKQGLSRDQFIEYYESNHAPLILKLMPEIREYRRNFFETEGAFEFGAARQFDVVTELWFEDRAAYDRFVERSTDPDIARQIAEDEENVFDRGATRMYIVEERSSPSRAPAGTRHELRELHDERDIVRQLSRFARILDRKEWDALEQVFATDLTFEYGEGEKSGLSALTEQMRRYLDICGGTQHLLGSILVDLDGDTAISRAYVQARHQRTNDPVGPIFDSNGEYVDRWERRPQGWRIVRRDAIWATQSGDPAILYPTHD
ncbi:EthD family reductase [Novosphingobium aquimarinum]|uniref:EthD family reductase n=1 Tax=Novosphingobium aquimarinum TaxID=2682494 RepID=UPI0012EC9CDA|nr:EthD family reductase [Novosphingobium aquimarinum]